MLKEVFFSILFSMKSSFKSTAKRLWELFWIFFKIGAVTFGGGLAMLSILEKELVEKKKWVTKETLLDYFAIGQSTPGIIAVNTATFLGYTRAGVLGGCIATLGVITPSIIIITIVALFLTGLSDVVVVQKALKGINIAVSALLVKVVFDFRKNVMTSVFAVCLFIAAFCLILFCKVNTVFVILGSVILGVILYFFDNWKSKKALSKEDK